MSKELIFVGYTNGYQIAYAKDSEGTFYPDTDNECYIPLYMLKTHTHRIESTSNGHVTFEKVRKPTNEEKAISELVDKIQLNTEILTAIMERKPLQGSDYHAISCTIKNNQLLIAKHKQSKGERDEN